jgi:hypothetical protein
VIATGMALPWGGMIEAFGAGGGTGVGGAGTYQVSVASPSNQTGVAMTATPPSVWTPTAEDSGWGMMFTGGMAVGYNAPWDSATGVDFVPAFEQYVSTAYPSPQGETGQAALMHWRHLADRAANRFERVYAGFDAGVGGYKITDLAQGTIPYNNMLAALSRQAAICGFYGVNVECKSIHWAQGANDDAASVLYATYYSNFSAIVSNFQTDIPAATGQGAGAINILIAQEAAGPSGVGRTSAAAHYDASRALSHVYISTPCYFLQTPDGYHLYPWGYALLGEYGARAEDAILNGSGWKGLRPAAGGIMRSSNTITITLEGNVSPVLFDTTGVVPAQTHQGFTWTDNTGGVTISTVSVANVGNVATITIPLAGGSSSGGQLGYAWGASGAVPAPPFFGAMGNVRDSDSAPSYANVPGYPSLYRWLQSFSVTVS